MVVSGGARRAGDLRDHLVMAHSIGVVGERGNRAGCDDRLLRGGPGEGADGRHPAPSGQHGEFDPGLRRAAGQGGAEAAGDAAQMRDDLGAGMFRGGIGCARPGAGAPCAEDHRSPPARGARRVMAAGRVPSPRPASAGRNRRAACWRCGGSRLPGRRGAPPPARRWSRA